MSQENYNKISQKNSLELRYMSVAYAAKYIGISERKLRDLIAEKDVRHIRLGKRVILRKADLDLYLESLVCC